MAGEASKEFSMDDLIAKGEGVYNTACAGCHQPNGQGIPGAFPAITGSAIATGAIDAHIDIIVNGKAGTAMQAFKEQLSAVDIAAVVTYQRNALGNSVGDMVQPSAIQK
jgi:cytochrome c oxidase subunit 2